MAIPYSILNSQDPAEQQAALQVQADTNNGVIPSDITAQFNAPVTPQEVQQAAPLQSVMSQDQNGTTQEDPGFSWGRLASALGAVVQDPAFLQSANAFGASLSGDVNSYNQYMNAYSQTMDARRQEQTAKFNAQLARKQQLEDQASERSWQANAAYDSALYKSYTPESVRAYKEAGNDPSLLVKLPMDEYQRQSLDIQRQNADTAQANSLTKYAASTASRLGGYDGNDQSNDGMGRISLTKQGKPSQSAGIGADGQEYFMGTNSNYVWSAAGQPMLSSEFKSQGRTLTEANKVDSKISEQADSIDSAISQLNTTKAAMDAAMSPTYQEGRENSQGTIMSRLPTIRQNSGDYEARIETLRGNTFLQQRQMLKGQGAITDYESGRAEAAWGTLTNPRASVAEQNKAYDEMTNIINTGIARLQEKRSKLGGNSYGRDVNAPSITPSTGSSLPSGWSVTKQ